MIGFGVVCVGVVSYGIYKQMQETSSEEVIQYSAVMWEDEDVWEDDDDDGTEMSSSRVIPSLTSKIEMTNI